MTTKRIPSATVPRLTLYYRALVVTHDKDYISSSELSKITQFSAAQIRKDLAYFGQFGRSGKGYEINNLKESISSILGIDKEWNAALVGVGNLGGALLRYKGFVGQGFKITCAFDSDLSKVGKTFEGVLIEDVKDLPQIIAEKEIKIAMVTTSCCSKEEMQKNGKMCELFCRQAKISLENLI